MEKHAYALIKVVKHFRFYILNIHIIALVLDTTIKSILTRQDFGTKRGSWIANIQEYDMEIFPTKLVCNKGLFHPMGENEPLQVEDENSSSLPIALFLSIIDDWFSDMAY